MVSQIQFNRVLLEICWILQLNRNDRKFGYSGNERPAIYHAQYKTWKLHKPFCHTAHSCTRTKNISPTYKIVLKVFLTPSANSITYTNLFLFSKPLKANSALSQTQVDLLLSYHQAFNCTLMLYFSNLTRKKEVHRINLIFF